MNCANRNFSSLKNVNLNFWSWNCELELRELELRELELLELELCPLGGIIVPRSFSLGNRIGQKCIDVFAFIIQKSGK